MNRLHFDEQNRSRDMEAWNRLADLREKRGGEDNMLTRELVCISV